MKQTVSLSAIVFALTAAAACTEIQPWQQCSGASMQIKGDVRCTKGYTCVERNKWYSQCRLSALVVEIPPQAAYAQCGGQGYTGSTTCISGYACKVLNLYYSQCVPGSSNPVYSAPESTKSSTIAPTSVVSSSSAVVVTSSTVPTTAPAASPTSASVIISSTPAGAGPVNPTSCPVNAPPSSAGNVQHGGVNIAGFDFGCYTDGTCTPSNVYPPIGGSFPDGVAQMNHFSENGFNTFRLPVGWQYLTNNVIGGDLDATNFGKYDSLVRNCLNRGAFCVIDIHNYARWNGAIIGQGGPSNEQFAALWTSLATHYKDQPKVIFGIMNEPHDVDIQTWATTVQAVVTAIRSTGATSQTILLPGDNYTGAGTFISSGSAQFLNAVTNPDGSITNLVFDVHQYLDFDNSGTNTECVTNNIANAFGPLAQWLRCHNRKAFLTETGGGNTVSCGQNLCQELQFLNANSDVYMGFIGWAAGSFSADYALTMTPHADGSNQQLVTQCFIPNFHP